MGADHDHDMRAFLAIVTVLALLGLGVWAWPTVRPGCAVGVTGTAATVTVQGFMAGRVCDDIRRGFGGTYQLTQRPTQPVVCEYDVSGKHFIVRDEGILKIVGNAICLALSQERIEGFGAPTGSPTPRPDATATAQAAQQEAVRNADRTLADAIRAAHASASTLAQLPGFDDILRSYARHLTAMQDHLRELQADAARQPLTCGQLATVNGDLATMHGDRAAIYGDRAAFDLRRSSVTSAIAALERSIRSAEQAQDLLQAAVQKNSTGVPSPTFTMADVSELTGHGRTQIAAAVTALADAAARAEQDERDAAQLLSTATESVSRLRCSG